MSFMADFFVALWIEEFPFGGRIDPVGSTTMGLGRLSSLLREGSELSSIDYSRSSSRRDPLPIDPRRTGEFKRAGGGTILGTACEVRGQRAHVSVVLIHPTKLDASHFRTLCAR